MRETSSEGTNNKSEQDIIQNNRITLEGIVEVAPEFSHSVYGEDFYIFYVKVPRQSGSEDILPVIISERLANPQEIREEQPVRITGNVRTYNKVEEETGKTRLIVQVFVRSYEELESCEVGVNDVYLSGFICKETNYRKTPLGREICDALVAVNRPYGKSDYIPTICWGRNASFAGRLTVGQSLELIGRLQSRDYQKQTPDGETETRVAYELSVSKLNLLQ